MSFTLTYLQTRLKKTEDYSSLRAAIGRACVMIDAEECTDFRIAGDDGLVLSDDQIVAQCHAVKSIVQTGRMPMRAS